MLTACSLLCRYAQLFEAAVLHLVQPASDAALHHRVRHLSADDGGNSAQPQVTASPPHHICACICYLFVCLFVSLFVYDILPQSLACCLPAHTAGLYCTGTIAAVPANQMCHTFHIKPSWSQPVLSGDHACMQCLTFRRTYILGRKIEYACIIQVVWHYKSILLAGFNGGCSNRPLALTVCAYTLFMMPSQVAGKTGQHCQNVFGFIPGANPLPVLWHSQQHTLCCCAHACATLCCTPCVCVPCMRCTVL
jgi:hypothetical protein